MARTRLNTVQLTTAANNDLATDAELAVAISAHIATTNPHPQYIMNTTDNLLTVISSGIANAIDSSNALALNAHVNELDPHLQYLTEEEEAIALFNITNDNTNGNAVVNIVKSTTLDGGEF